MNEQNEHPELLTDEELSEQWHYFMAADSNDGSWHYTLNVLRGLAKAQLAKVLKHHLDKMSRFHCKRCGNTRYTEAEDGKIVYSDGICGDCLAKLSRPELREKINNFEEKVRSHSNNWETCPSWKVDKARNAILLLYPSEEEIRKDERDRIRQELGKVSCLEDYADMSKALTSLIYALKES